MPFTFERLDIDGLILITPRRFADDRGWFMELFRESAFRDAGIAETFVQDNCSRSSRGVVRGLHYQTDPHAQGKLVWTLAGRVWDVAVDIRPESPTFGEWRGVELDEVNQSLFYMPPGFAHGFIALADNTIVQYKCTAEYDAASERGIRYDDPELAISWPAGTHVLSDRDAHHPGFDEMVAQTRRRPEGSGG